MKGAAISINSLLKNPSNPRIIKDHKFKQLMSSIREFPQMMTLRPIIIDEHNIVLGGNMRLQAIKELGYVDIPAEWVKKVKGLSEERKKEFVIKDNANFGEWNWDELANEWDEKNLNDWGLDIPNFNEEPDNNENDHLNVPIPHYTLKIKFVNQQDCQRLFEELAGKGYDVKIVK